jgi:hypothetical protein
MIEQIFCESDSEKNYKMLSEDRKQKYQKIYKNAACCPEQYILSVDVASPYNKDQSCVIKYDYNEYIKGNLVIVDVKHF